jgi:choloylglycine hydrolase
MEWGSFDLNSRILVFPRGHEFIGETPEGRNGKRWKAKYGVAGIDMLERPLLADGMNEKGLAVGLFYHPDYAEYPEYDPSRASQTMAVTDIGQYLLSTCADVSEVRQALGEIAVARVIEKVLGIPAPLHLLVSDSSQQQIVVEWDVGELKIFESQLGVLTNAPTYDWHLTNLRNYINLSPVGLPSVQISEMDFRPLGGGSGMIGLPGDFTPPSRFVRAVAFSQTARKTADGPETVYEIFRVLDNFNVPLGGAERHGEAQTEDLRSSTLWTTAHDLKNRVFYYHTQHSRQVRKVDVGSLDFDTLIEMQVSPLDRQKTQAIEDRTPRK